MADPLGRVRCDHCKDSATIIGWSLLLGGARYALCDRHHYRAPGLKQTESRGPRGIVDAAYVRCVEVLRRVEERMRSGQWEKVEDVRAEVRRALAELDALGCDKQKKESRA